MLFAPSAARIAVLLARTPAAGVPDPEMPQGPVANREGIRTRMAHSQLSGNLAALPIVLCGHVRSFTRDAARVKRSIGLAAKLS